MRNWPMEQARAQFALAELYNILRKRGTGHKATARWRLVMCPCCGEPMRQAAERRGRA